MQRITLILSLLLLPGNARALRLIPISDPMRIEQAERIIVGRLRENGTDSIILVEDVLKGSAEPKLIRTTSRPAGLASPKVLWVKGAPGSRISYFTYIEDGSPQWNLYQMLHDPSPLLDLEKHSENIAIIQVLGYLFDPVNVTSPEAPEVARRLGRDYRAACYPWDFQGALDMRCRPDPERRSRLEILSMEPDNETSRGFRWSVMGHGMEESMRDSLPESFSLRIDTLPPEARGALSFASATAYLRERLDSRDPRIQIAAVKALARARDLNAVPPVIRLIDHGEEDLTRATLSFLGQSRDPRAVEPLCRLLAINAPLYPEKHWLSNGAAQALGMIGDARAIPFLESAAAHGVEGACESLSRCGRAESIGVILQTASDDGLPNWAGVSLFWLVHRSNKSPEPWMDKDEMQGVAMRPALVRKWKRWWAENQSDLKLVRDFGDALMAWHPPVYKPPQGDPQHFRSHWFKYLLGGMFLGFAVFLARKRSLAEAEAHEASGTPSIQRRSFHERPPTRDSKQRPQDR